MPQRMVNVLAAAAGALIVAGLVLIGVDVYRSARTGTRWKRRLIAAGLFLLASLGIAPAGAAPEVKPGQSALAAAAKADTSLDEAAEWRTVVAAWRFLTPLADSGRSTTAQRKRAETWMKSARACVRGLASRHLLAKAEADLLAGELDRLQADIYRNPPTDVTVTCYKMLYVAPARRSLDRLGKRLVLLEQTAAAKTLRADVLFRALATIEKDIDTLSRPEALGLLSQAERARADKVRDGAKAQLEKIRARLRVQAGALEKTRQWHAILKAWKEVAPLAESGQSTMAQRKAGARLLAAAKTAAAELALAGLVSSAEAGLLRSEAERLRAEMFRNPPTDAMETCYDMAYIPPAQKSLQRINLRLPLLERLAASGKVRPAALKKVIPSIRADLKTLSDPQQVAKLQGRPRAEAERLRTQAELALKKIETLLEAGK